MFTVEHVYCVLIYLLYLCRKKTKQLVEQTSVRFANDTEELINKHNKRWSAKLGAVRKLTIIITITFLTAPNTSLLC